MIRKQEPKFERDRFESKGFAIGLGPSGQLDHETTMHSSKGSYPISMSFMPVYQWIGSPIIRAELWQEYLALCKEESMILQEGKGDNISYRFNPNFMKFVFWGKDSLKDGDRAMVWESEYVIKKIGKHWIAPANGHEWGLVMQDDDVAQCWTAGVLINTSALDDIFGSLLMFLGIIDLFLN